MQIHPYYASVDFLEEYDSTYDIVFLDIEMPESDGLTAYTGMNPPRARRISARLPEKICHPTGRVRQ